MSSHGSEMPRTLLFTSLTLRCGKLLRGLTLHRQLTSTRRASPALPAVRDVSMPCGSVELRNNEPRNVRMYARRIISASLLHATGVKAEVGTLLRIDGVENAMRDATGQPARA